MVSIFWKQLWDQLDCVSLLQATLNVFASCMGALSLAYDPNFKLN